MKLIKKGKLASEGFLRRQIRIFETLCSPSFTDGDGRRVPRAGSPNAKRRRAEEGGRKAERKSQSLSWVSSVPDFAGAWGVRHTSRKLKFSNFIYLTFFVERPQDTCIVHTYIHVSQEQLWCNSVSTSNTPRVVLCWCSFRNECETVVAKVS